MQLILTGERIKADEARHYGLVNELVQYADLAQAALRWAAKLNAASPLAVRAAKAAALARLNHPLEVALTTRFRLVEQYATSEGRKPVWRGK